MCFVFNDAWAIVSDGSSALPVSIQSSSSRNIASLDTSTFTLPAHLGEVRYSYEGDPNRVLIHIQDAHCNYFAQKKISEIIDYLQREYGIGMVNLEGGAGDYDMNVFANLSGNEIRNEVADYFVKKGEINGAELYAITNPGSVELWGVEDKALYRSNLKVYRDSLGYKGEVDVALEELTYTLDNLKRHIFSKDLLRIDEAYTMYKSGELDFKEYLSFLIRQAKDQVIPIRDYANLYLISQAMEQEAAVDFKRADRERDAIVDALKRRLSKNDIDELASKSLDFKTKKIAQEVFYAYLLKKAKKAGINIREYPALSAYIVYVSLFDAVDRFKIMEEIDDLEKEVKAPFLKNDEQRKLDQLTRNLSILKNIFSITLTKTDYDHYLKNKGSFYMNDYERFIRREAPKYGIRSELSDSVRKIDRHIDEISRFYEYSFKRDDVFLENLKFGIGPQGKSTSILMTGGFHTDNLCDLLRGENISFVSVVPKFTSGADYESPYFELLAGQTSGIQEMLVSAMARSSMIQIASKLNGVLADRSSVETFNAAVVILAKLIEKRGPGVVNEEIDIELSHNGNSVFVAVGEGGEYSMHMSLEELGLTEGARTEVAVEEVAPTEKPTSEMTEEEFVEYLKNDAAARLEELKTEFMRGNVDDFGTAYSDLLDYAITALADYMGMNDEFTFLAMGSYGRRGTPYGTDADIFILMDDYDESDPEQMRKKEELRAKAKRFVQIMDKEVLPFTILDWVGYPNVYLEQGLYTITRSEFKNEYMKIQEEDNKNQISLKSPIDMRYISGNHPEGEIIAFFNDVKEEAGTIEKLRHPSMEAEDIRVIFPRMHKVDLAGDYAYHLKEGSGGLRALGVLVSFLRIQTNVPHLDWNSGKALKDFLDQMAENEILSADEAEQLNEAQVFLVNMRSAVNFAWEMPKNISEKKRIYQEEISKGVLPGKLEEVEETFRKEISKDVADIMGVTESEITENFKKHTDNVINILEKVFTVELFLKNCAESERAAQKIEEEEIEKIRDQRLKEADEAEAEGGFVFPRETVEASIDTEISIARSNLPQKRRDRIYDAIKRVYDFAREGLNQYSDNEGLYREKYVETLDLVTRAIARSLGIEKTIAISTKNNEQAWRRLRDNNEFEFILFHKDVDAIEIENLSQILGDVTGHVMDPVFINVSEYDSEKHGDYLEKTIETGSNRLVLGESGFADNVFDKTVKDFFNVAGTYDRGKTAAEEEVYMPVTTLQDEAGRAITMLNNVYDFTTKNPSLPSASSVKAAIHDGMRTLQDGKNIVVATVEPSAFSDLNSGWKYHTTVDKVRDAFGGTLYHMLKSEGMGEGMLADMGIKILDFYNPYGGKWHYVFEIDENYNEVDFALLMGKIMDSAIGMSRKTAERLGVERPEAFNPVMGISAPWSRMRGILSDALTDIEDRLIRKTLEDWILFHEKSPPDEAMEDIISRVSNDEQVKEYFSFKFDVNDKSIFETMMEVLKKESEKLKDSTLRNWVISHKKTTTPDIAIKDLLKRIESNERLREHFASEFRISSDKTHFSSDFRKILENLTLRNKIEHITAGDFYKKVMGKAVLDSNDLLVYAENEYYPQRYMPWASRRFRDSAERDISGQWARMANLFSEALKDVRDGADRVLGIDREFRRKEIEELMAMSKKMSPSEENRDILISKIAESPLLAKYFSVKLGISVIPEIFETRFRKEIASMNVFNSEPPATIKRLFFHDRYQIDAWISKAKAQGISVPKGKGEETVPWGEIAKYVGTPQHIPDFSRINEEKEKLQEELRVLDGDVPRALQTRIDEFMKAVLKIGLESEYRILQGTPVINTITKQLLNRGRSQEQGAFFRVNIDFDYLSRAPRKQGDVIKSEGMLVLRDEFKKYFGNNVATVQKGTGDELVVIGYFEGDQGVAEQRISDVMGNVNKMLGNLMFRGEKIRYLVPGENSEDEEDMREWSPSISGGMTFLNFDSSLDEEVLWSGAETLDSEAEIANKYSKEHGRKQVTLYSEEIVSADDVFEAVPLEPGIPESLLPYAAQLEDLAPYFDQAQFEGEISERGPPRVGAGSWWNNWVYGVGMAPWFEAAIPKYGIAKPIFHMASPQFFWIAAITASMAAALVYFALHLRYNRDKGIHLAQQAKMPELVLFTGLTFISTFLILMHSTYAKPFLVVTIGAHFILNAIHYWSNIVSFTKRAKKFLTTPVGFITTMGFAMFAGTLAIYASSGVGITMATVLKALAVEGWIVVFGYLLFYSYNAQKSENKLVKASGIVSAIVTLAVFSLFPRIADANVLTYQPKPAAIVREITALEEAPAPVLDEATPPEVPVEAAEEMKTLESPGVEAWVPLVRQELERGRQAGVLDLTRAVIHHTDSHDVPASTINDWHVERGFSGIGYNLVIRKDGSVEIGRSMTKKGAHALGRNDRIGIVLTGRNEFTDAQRATLEKLLSELGVKSVQGHHENCPGIGMSLEDVVGPTILVQAPDAVTPSQAAGTGNNNEEVGRHIREQMIAMGMDWSGDDRLTRAGKLEALVAEGDERVYEKDGYIFIKIKGLVEQGQFAHIGLGDTYGRTIVYIDANVAENEQDRAIVERHEFAEIKQWESAFASGLMRGIGSLGEARRWMRENLEEARRMTENFHEMANITPGANVDVLVGKYDVASYSSGVDEFTPSQAAEIGDTTPDEIRVVHLTELDKLPKILEHGFFQTYAEGTFMEYSEDVFYPVQKRKDPVELVFYAPKRLLIEVRGGQQHGGQAYGLSRESEMVSEDDLVSALGVVLASQFVGSKFHRMPSHFIDIDRTIARTRARVTRGDLSDDAFQRFVTMMEERRRSMEQELEQIMDSFHGYDRRSNEELLVALQRAQDLFIGLGRPERSRLRGGFINYGSEIARRSAMVEEQMRQLEAVVPVLSGEQIVVQKDLGGGASGARLVLDRRDGRQKVLKFGADDGHTRNEALANFLYAEADMDVPQAEIVNIGGRLALLTSFVEGDKVTYEEMASSQGMTEGFAVDAWLANWDIANNRFNVIRSADGKIFRIDNGGSMGYRASGDLKGSLWGADVVEIQSMRQRFRARTVFGHLTDADVAVQIRNLTKNMTPEKIEKALEKAGYKGGDNVRLQKMLEARLSSMVAWAARVGQTTTPSQAAGTGKNNEEVGRHIRERMIAMGMDWSDDDRQTRGEKLEALVDQGDERVYEKDGYIFIKTQGLVEQGQFAHIGLGDTYGRTVVYIDANVAENDADRAIVEWHEIAEISAWENALSDGQLGDASSLAGARKWMMQDFWNLDEAKRMTEEFHQKANSEFNVDILANKYNDAGYSSGVEELSQGISEREVIASLGEEILSEEFELEYQTPVPGRVVSMGAQAGRITAEIYDLIKEYVDDDFIIKELMTNAVDGIFERFDNEYSEEDVYYGDVDRAVITLKVLRNSTTGDVSIIIRDNGSGIPSSMMEGWREEFVSTKGAVDQNGDFFYIGGRNQGIRNMLGWVERENYLLSYISKVSSADEPGFRFMQGSDGSVRTGIVEKPDPGTTIIVTVPAEKVGVEVPTPSQAAAVKTEAPIQRPLVDNSLDVLRIEEFINSHEDPEVRELARFLTSNISYISQDEFENSMAKAVSAFRQSMAGKPFVSYIPYGANRSNRWAYRIAEARGLSRAENIFYIADEKVPLDQTDPESFIEWHMKNHPNVKDVAYVDDAAYSGRQLENILDQFSWYAEDGKYLDNITVHLVIPYVSSEARSKIYAFNKKIKDKGLSMRVALHENKTDKTETISEMFEGLKDSDNALHKRLWPLFSKVYDYDGNRSNKTMFYFQHKTPDIFSFFSVEKNRSMVPLLEGPVVDGEGKYVSQMALAPPVMPPYSAGYSDWVEKNIVGTEWESRLTDRAPPETDETEVAAERRKVVEARFSEAEMMARINLLARRPEMFDKLQDLIFNDLDKMKQYDQWVMVLNAIPSDRKESRLYSATRAKMIGEEFVEEEAVKKAAVPDVVPVETPSQGLDVKTAPLSKEEQTEQFTAEMSAALTVLRDVDPQTTDWVVTPGSDDFELAREKEKLDEEAVDVLQERGKWIKGEYRDRSYKDGKYAWDTRVKGYTYSGKESDEDLRVSFKDTFANVWKEMNKGAYAANDPRAIIFVPGEKRDIAMDVLYELMGIKKPTNDKEVKEAEFKVGKKFVVAKVPKENILESGLVDEVNHINLGKGFLRYKRGLDQGEDLTRETSNLMAYLEVLAGPGVKLGAGIIKGIINGLEYLPMMRPVDLNAWREEQDARLQILRSL